jgi:hypothetical protein
VTAGVTLISSTELGRIRNAFGSRLGKLSRELGRATILEQCTGLATRPGGIAISRFIVSREANVRRGHRLVATVEDSRGILQRDYEALTRTINRYEGITMSWPALAPHITIGRLVGVDRDAAVLTADQLTEQFQGTGLAVLPIQK